MPPLSPEGDRLYEILSGEIIDEALIRYIFGTPFDESLDVSQITSDTLEQIDPRYTMSYWLVKPETLHPESDAWEAEQFTLDGERTNTRIKLYPNSARPVNIHLLAKNQPLNHYGKPSDVLRSANQVFSTLDH